MPHKQLLEDLNKFPTAVLYDAAGRLGISGAVRGLKSLRHGAHMAGRALTVRFVPKSEAAETSCNLYDVMSQAADDSILVVDFGIDRWILGANLTAFAQRCRLRGLLVDGCVRDVSDLRKADLPIFCRGASVEGYGVASKLGAFDVPVTCGGVDVSPGDYVIADDDGAFIVPAARAEELLFQAEDIMEIDRTHGEGVRAGWDLERLHESLARWRTIRR